MYCVHIVDDDEHVRRMLEIWLKTSGHPTRSYKSADALLAALPDLGAGCVLADVRMPGMGGLELVRRLREAGAAHPIIMFSGEADIAMAVEAMKVGASDFLQKPIRRQALMEAIVRALEAPAQVVAPPKRASGLNLTPRQMTILQGLVAGKRNKTIAAELCLSVRTVEGYRSELMSKLNAQSLSELIRIAIAAGL